MLNLSIMPLNEEYVDELCEDIIAQQREGASTHAMMMMTFNPEGTPAVNKAEQQCRIYDKFRMRLDKAGAKHGVLVQATLGHITVPSTPYPFQPSVSLVTGAPRVVTCCPLDPTFQEYIKGQMRILAEHKPSIVMLDDDLGLLYKQTKGCACKYHMAEFNRRAGTNMSREELYAHTQGTGEEDKRYTDIYVDVQRDALVSVVKAMREGLDEVDPTIQGVVSGIYVTTFCEFSGDTARAFAGKGNPSIVRLNGGPYAKAGGRFFTENMFRAAILRENIKEKVDIFLAETDTCPQNRYSTSAALLHGHFTASILEGATGAKHWLTRTGKTYEPMSGKAYRKVLSKYAGFYEKMTEYARELTPFGCRIPLTLMQNYGFVEASRGLNLSPWATCVLERFGLPMYFANQGEGAVFLDDFSADGFDDDEIRNFLSGTLILSAGAAEKLVNRGFGKDIGVEVCAWDGAVIGGELLYGDHRLSAQYGTKQLITCCDQVEELSFVFHRDTITNEIERLFPGVTRFNNALGGEVIVFSGTPDMPFKYFTAFSLLNEIRKRQFIDILSRKNHLPLYYPEDGEVYLRAGYLSNGEMMAAFFNLGFDILEDVPVVCARNVQNIEKLNTDGTRSKCEFSVEDGIVRVKETMNPLIPVVLFFS